MSLTRSAARGTVQTVGAQLFRMVLQLVGLSVLARLLVPEEYALVAMVTAIIGFADILRDGGLTTAAVQSPTLSRDERTNLFWLNSALGAAATILTLAATPLIVALYDEPKLARIVPALAGIYLLSGVNAQYRVSLQRDLRFGALAMADVVSQTAGLAVAIALAAFGAGYWALVAQLVVAAVVVFLVNLRNCRWVPGWPRRATSVRRFFTFGMKVFGSQALNYGVQSIDSIVIGVHAGARPLGIYNRAAQIVVTPINQFNVPLSRVAIPVLSRVQGEPERFARAAGRAQLVGCYVTASVLALVAGLAHPISDVLLGPGWDGVAPILTVLAAGGVFRAVSQLNYWLFLARGRPGAQLRLDAWAKPAMMVVIASGLVWGAMGVAAASGIAWGLYWIVGLVVVTRTVAVPAGPLFRRALLAMGVVAIPAGLASRAGSVLVDGAVAQLAVGLGVAAAVVGVLVLVVGPVRRDALVLADLARQTLGRGRSRQSTVSV